MASPGVEPWRARHSHNIGRVRRDLEEEVWTAPYTYTRFTRALMPHSTP